MHNPGNPVCYFSVLIPAYNRAHTLPRTFTSLEKQTFRDFEVVIVDDGSGDGTRALVKHWRSTVDFPVHYIYQENQGKHAAHNTGVAAARGMMTVILDSDDWFSDNTLERIRYHWESIPELRREDYAGVEGLSAMGDGKVAGDKYPQDIFDCDYLGVRMKHHIRGDKCNAILTAILRQFPYPVVEGENHMPPAYVFKRIAHHYKTRHINEVLQFKEYQPGGLTSDRFALRMRVPRSLRMYHFDDISLHKNDMSMGYLIINYARYIRYSLHSGVTLSRQWMEVPSKVFWLAGLPKGFIAWIRDRRRMARRNKSSMDKS